MLPLSGPYHKFGNRALRAIRLALDRFNSRSIQPPIKLLIRDTNSDSMLIENLVNDLDEQRVSLIIGPMVTSRNAAMEAQKRKIPIITLTQKAGIPETGDYVFRNFFTPEMQVDTLLKNATGKFAAKSFAILYPDDAYGNTFMKLFRRKAPYYGAEIVRIVSYTPSQTDFSPQIKQLGKIPEIKVNKIIAPHRNTYKNEGERQRKEVLRHDFEAVFIPDSTDKIALIAPQLAYYNINDVLLMGTNLWHSDYLVDVAFNYVQEAILADCYYGQGADKVVQNFIRSFEKEYGERPGIIDGLAYDTALMAFNILSGTDIRSRIELKNRLKDITNYDGITGLTSFKANGEAKKKLILLQIIGRNFVELQ